MMYIHDDGRYALTEAQTAKKRRGRPSLFPADYYDAMSGIFGTTDKRKIQNAHYWATASNIIDKRRDEIPHSTYLVNSETGKIRQCALTELGRLHELLVTHYGEEEATSFTINLAKTICESGTEHNRSTRDIEVCIRNIKKNIAAKLKG
ncbi:MAG: hypothetical protein VB115_14400 [Christensenellaceae bacterium]|nr:hypothetical protein [Christensenellaceae bacterium]